MNCTHTMPDGFPCRCHAQTGKTLCRAHDPERQAERIASSSKAGESRKRQQERYRQNAERADPVMAEKQFARIVVDLAKTLGYRVYFTWNSLHSPGGFPDLTLLHAGKKRLLFAELKSSRGELTVEQREWLADLHVSGAEAYCWKPDELERIVEILQGER